MDFVGGKTVQRDRECFRSALSVGERFDVVSGLFGEGRTTTESAGLKVIEYRYYELASIRLSAHWISQRKIATSSNGKGAICRNSPSIVGHV